MASENFAHADDGVIDCDIHNVVPSLRALFPYLPEYWKEQARLTGFTGATDSWYPGSAEISARPGSRPPDGPAGSRLALLQEQVLDPGKVCVGILQCAYSVDGVHNPDAAVALSRAVNDWQIDEWLSKDTRLRASIVVPIQYPELAAQEVDRVGAHPGFIQVMLPVRSAAPYGNRRFHVLYEAALRHDLVIAIHSGGAPGNAPSSVGWFATYVEDYTNMASVFQTQLLSLICEGVFDRFPETRVVLAESGCTWLPSLLWRMDKEWKGLRREVPWVRRLPSEYVHSHVRLTIQPFDSPPEAGQVREIVEQMGSEDLLMFSTDYPHWHFDSPEQALPPGLPDSLVRKILSGNARDFYRL
jgi:predicted TIM-barrel fold metal-dependent hydrolase